MGYNPTTIGPGQSVTVIVAYTWVIQGSAVLISMLQVKGRCGPGFFIWFINLLNPELFLGLCSENGKPMIKSVTTLSIFYFVMG